MRQGTRRERAGRIEQMGADQLHEGLREPGIGDGRVDREGGVDRQHRMHQRPVEQAHMVRRDHHAGADLRQVLEPPDLDTEQGLEDEDAEIAHAFLAPAAQDQQHGDEIAEADDEEERAELDAQRLGDAEGDAGASHEARRDYVDARDHTGPPLRRGPGLHLREGRHYEEAARDREAGEADERMPAAG